MGLIRQGFAGIALSLRELAATICFPYALCSYYLASRFYCQSRTVRTLICNVAVATSTLKFEPLRTQIHVKVCSVTGKTTPWRKPMPRHGVWNETLAVPRRVGQAVHGVDRRPCPACGLDRRDRLAQPGTGQRPDSLLTERPRRVFVTSLLKIIGGLGDGNPRRWSGRRCGRVACPSGGTKSYVRLCCDPPI